MFGFSLSPLDKEIISTLEGVLIAWGVPEAAAKESAKEVFTSTKRETKARFGRNIYATDAGDIFLKNSDFMTPRRAEGVTDSDILRFWNRPMLLVLAELKLLTIGAATILSEASSTPEGARDPIKVGIEFRKVAPDFGDPTEWNLSHPAYRSLTKEDAHIYPELMPRIKVWTQKTSKTDQKIILARYSTYNAMVRDLIRREEL